jgi:hypothetical protein
VLLCKTYEKTEKEHFAPEMSQCNPREDNGYPRQAVSSVDHPDADADTTDHNGRHPEDPYRTADEIVVQFQLAVSIIRSLN